MNISHCVRTSYFPRYVISLCREINGHVPVTWGVFFSPFSMAADMWPPFHPQPLFENHLGSERTLASLSTPPRPPPGGPPDSKVISLTVSWMSFTRCSHRLHRVGLNSVVASQFFPNDREETATGACARLRHLPVFLGQCIGYLGNLLPLTLQCALCNAIFASTGSSYLKNLHDMTVHVCGDD